MIICTGVGKSFNIAEVGASLLRSVGIDAIALHATDLMHGCMGVVRGQTDVVVAVTHSGATREVVNVLGMLATRDPRVIVITGDPESLAARYADQLVCYEAKGGGPYETIPGEALHAQLDFFVQWACDAAGDMTYEELKSNHPGGTLYERPA